MFNLKDYKINFNVSECFVKLLFLSTAHAFLIPKEYVSKKSQERYIEACEC